MSWRMVLRMYLRHRWGLFCICLRGKLALNISTTFIPTLTTYDPVSSLYPPALTHFIALVHSLAPTMHNYRQKLFCSLP